jgi:hypothetical protein
VRSEEEARKVVEAARECCRLLLKGVRDSALFKASGGQVRHLPLSAAARRGPCSARPVTLFCPSSGAGGGRRRRV